MKYLVDGSDLTSIADAIRAKGGTNASLAFPSDFISAMNNLGGGDVLNQIIDGTIISYTNNDIVDIGDGAFRGASLLTYVDL